MTTSPSHDGPVPDDPARPVASLRADVADAVAGTDALDDRPVAEHVAVYERLHTVLGEALSAGPDRT